MLTSASLSLCIFFMLYVHRVILDCEEDKARLVRCKIDDYFLLQRGKVHGPDLFLSSRTSLRELDKTDNVHTVYVQQY